MDFLDEIGIHTDAGVMSFEATIQKRTPISSLSAQLYLLQPPT
jgi:hypothetical protein